MQVNTTTRGICLAMTDTEQNFFPRSSISFEASKLGRMQELHLLRLDGCNMVHDGSCSGYQQLRWVQWRSYQFRSLPAQLKLQKLVVLDLSHSYELRCLWEENVHVMVSLTESVPPNIIEIGQNRYKNFYYGIIVCNGYHPY